MFQAKPEWVVDEWTYGQYMSTQSDTYGEIRQHWNTFIDYGQLEKSAHILRRSHSGTVQLTSFSIAAVGLNTIRVQIGCMYSKHVARG